MPDTITVQIPPSEDDEIVVEEEGDRDGDGDHETKPKTVTVEIGRKLITRNVLCGYKNKRTGKSSSGLKG